MARAAMRTAALLLCAAAACAHENLVQTLSAEERAGVGVVITASVADADDNSTSSAAASIVAVVLSYSVRLPTPSASVSAMAEPPALLERTVNMTRVPELSGGCAHAPCDVWRPGAAH